MNAQLQLIRNHISIIPPATTQSCFLLKDNSIRQSSSRQSITMLNTLVRRAADVGSVVGIALDALQELIAVAVSFRTHNMQNCSFCRFVGARSFARITADFQLLMQTLRTPLFANERPLFGGISVTALDWETPQKSELSISDSDVYLASINEVCPALIARRT